MTPSQVKEARNLLDMQETARAYRSHLNRFPEHAPGIPRFAEFTIDERDEDSHHRDNLLVPREMAVKWLTELDEHIAARLRDLGVG